MALVPLAGRTRWRLPREWRPLAVRMAAAAAPGIGMLIYSTYIYFLTGNPLQWAAQNAAWGRVYRGVWTRWSAIASRHPAAVRALRLRVDAVARHDSDDRRAVFVLGSVWPVYRRFGVPYAALILVNVLLPLTMGGLLSMGRVTSVIFPTFLWLGAAVPASHRTGWLVGFAMLQALFAVAFFTWRPLY